MKQNSWETVGSMVEFLKTEIEREDERGLYYIENYVYLYMFIYILVE
jgi:hypothetical protein